jgi:hypothetical protein
MKHDFLAFSISCREQEKDEKEKERQKERRQDLTLVGCFNIVPPRLYEFQLAEGKIYRKP